MLPDETDKVWRFLSGEESLRDFILIGGTALTLRIEHRLSEDLDFVTLLEKLPRGRIAMTIRNAGKRGFLVEEKESPSASEEFIQGGLELKDYQQDYLFNQTVKVIFFTADTSLSRVLGNVPGEAPRIASVDELFKSKAVLLSKRSKTRDWYDLYHLMKFRGYSMEQLREAFLEGGIGSQFEPCLVRLCLGKAQKDDEGYGHLLREKASLEEMAEFFRDKRDRYEQSEAARALKESRRNTG